MEYDKSFIEIKKTKNKGQAISLSFVFLKASNEKIKEFYIVNKKRINIISPFPTSPRQTA